MKSLEKIVDGSLSKDAILFWDEPETNMNPQMIKPLVDSVIELAKMGVQVFITTHDYFVQQCFNIAATYQKNDKKKLQYNFMSLHRDDRTIICESSDSLLQLEHNAIMDEFDDGEFYRKFFNQLPGAKGVDILADSKTDLQFIEIKNCRG